MSRSSSAVIVTVAIGIVVSTAPNLPGDNPGAGQVLNTSQVDVAVSPMQRDNNVTGNANDKK